MVKVVRRNLGALLRERHGGYCPWGWKVCFEKWGRELAAQQPEGARGGNVNEPLNTEQRWREGVKRRCMRSEGGEGERERI